MITGIVPSTALCPLAVRILISSVKRLCFWRHGRYGACEATGVLIFKKMEGGRRKGGERNEEKETKEKWHKDILGFL